MDELINSLTAIIGPLLGVLAGFGVSMATARREEKGNRKRIVGIALEAILNVRHFVVSILVADRAMEKLFEGTNFPRNQLSQLLDWTLDRLGDPSKLKQRYDAAIETLAAIEPVSAYRMRSKENVIDMLFVFRQALRSNVSDAHIRREMDRMHKALEDFLRDDFEIAAVALATMHGSATLREVRMILAKSLDDNPEFEDYAAAARELFVYASRIEEGTISRDEKSAQPQPIDPSGPALPSLSSPPRFGSGS